MIHQNLTRRSTTTWKEYNISKSWRKLAGERVQKGLERDDAPLHALPHAVACTVHNPPLHLLSSESRGLFFTTPSARRQIIKGESSQFTILWAMALTSATISLNFSSPEASSSS